MSKKIIQRIIKGCWRQEKSNGYWTIQYYENFQTQVNVMV